MNTLAAIDTNPFRLIPTGGLNRAGGCRRGRRVRLLAPAAAVQGRRRGFTLIELILIIAILAITTALVVPRLGDFFRGRTLDSESRQLLALMRHAQSRAVSEGIPVVLWFNPEQGSYGLEQEPGYRETDPQALEFKLDSNLKFEIPVTGPFTVSTGMETAAAKYADLPHIRFLPDGAVSEASPRLVQVLGADGASVTFRFSRQRNQYELQATSDGTFASR